MATKKRTTTIRKGAKKAGDTFKVAKTRRYKPVKRVSRTYTKDSGGTVVKRVERVEPLQHMGGSSAQELFELLSKPGPSEVAFHAEQAARGGSVGADDYGKLVYRDEHGVIKPL